ncbi:TonB-dependent receptor [Ottowia thiooxydans]|uniref:TonB-dependent receptor n=1 Tax=Ottowia thiooxydans TaxID=219182 RepID=UPI00040ED939|nr:TonB-dependent receptor [Ottowia thiooxydans]
MSSLGRSLVLGAGFYIAISPAFAQADVQSLETVTVIGTGLPTEVLRNPASITVISAETIEQTAPVSVATLLRDVPGVQISEEGIERISIRGETARRVAILIDGQKLTDHTNYGQPVLVDPTTIERIEVVRGSSSVVSGSAAIGGVINIITKRGAGKPFSLSTTAGYMSATRGYRASASASGTVNAGPGQLDYNLSLGKMRQGDRRTPDGTLSPSDVEDRNIAGHLGYRLGPHYFGLKAQAFDLAANVYVGQPNFLISLPHRDLRKTGLFYEGTQLTPWLTKLSANLYRQTIDRDFRNDVSTAAGPLRIRVLSTSLDQQTTNGANLRAEMKFSARSRTVAGIEWEDDGLTADKTTNTTRTPPGTTTKTLRFDDAKTRSFSVFGQHEITLSDQLTATIGARGSRVNSDLRASATNGIANTTSSGSDSKFLGSAGLVWSPSKHLALRANISQGYIYPTLGQLFLTTTGGGVTLTGNPNLKPETSTTYELGARYAAGGTVLDATLFHARAKDYIATVSSGAIGSYENVDAAHSTGVELYAEHALGVWGLTPYTSFAAMSRQLRYGNGYQTNDGGSPSFAGKIGLRKDWRWGRTGGSVDLYVRGESKVSLRDNSGAVSGSASGYGTLNLRAHAEMANGFSLVAELNNLTNRRYTPYGQMPGAERSINLFLTKKF